MNRTHRILIGIVVTGAVIIAAIGFAGSYAAVRELAIQKDFGWFANVLPVGIDAGIVVLLALDLLLTWLRIPFPLLRQTAWLLTAATIAFNGAAAWPDPLGVGMHGVIPILFVVSVEAARHAIGRITDITADKHMESVRFWRWFLAPVPTFRLWRRMKLWELRRYDEVIRLEQDRLVYQARLRARYGRAWRRKAPVESLMPLRLARFGIPLAENAAAGLAAAGIDAPLALAPAPAVPTVDDQVGADEPAGGYIDVPELESPAPDTLPEVLDTAPAALPSGGEKLQEDTHPHSAEQVGTPLFLAAEEGALEPVYADRARTAGGAVHARIDSPQAEAEPVFEAPEAANGYLPGLAGRDLVDHLYVQLSPEEEASLSVRALADRWLLETRGSLSFETLRKYIARARKEYRDGIVGAGYGADDSTPDIPPQGGYSGEGLFLEHPVENGYREGLPGART
ncbi:DUF2637 domain-containing protein [Streptomyces sp. NPDC088733]|uniref:DUF2637 domain-containing protein n=1 Tax=Streptomyces sp. NPDC088733 TaxID=3365880 RepID=UPI0038148665